jgi:hypothetical protein
MKLKTIEITRGYKKSGNYNTISGSVSLNYELGASETIGEALTIAKTEVDTLLKKHYEGQDDWMNKLIDKPAKADVEGYK